MSRARDGRSLRRRPRGGAGVEEDERGVRERVSGGGARSSGRHRRRVGSLLHPAQDRAGLARRARRRRERQSPGRARGPRECRADAGAEAHSDERRVALVQGRAGVLESRVRRGIRRFQRVGVAPVPVDGERGLRHPGGSVRPPHVLRADERGRGRAGARARQLPRADRDGRVQSIRDHRRRRIATGVSKLHRVTSRHQVVRHGGHVRRRAVAGARPARANHRVHGDAGDVHAGEL